MGTSRTTGIGEYIRSARKKRNLTQVQLADAIDMTQRWVSEVERGLVVVPRQENMAALARVFEVPIEELYVAAGVASSQQGARRLVEVMPPVEVPDPNATIISLLQKVDLSDQDRYDLLLDTLQRWIRRDRERAGR